MTATAPTSTTPALMRVSTDRLRDGDVIRDHGMVLRLEGHDVYPATRFSTGETVHAFDGIVLNLDEVLADGHVPASFLIQYAPDGRTVLRRDVWRVQGNRHASWTLLARRP